MTLSPSMVWPFRMAWRDARRNRGRFFAYISAAGLGIGALIAAGSLRHNLEEALDRQAKPLLGADLVIKNSRPFDAVAEAFFSSLPYPRLREDHLTTVAFFPASGQSRLLEVRAVEEGFPFYGEVVSDPANALSGIFGAPEALIEEHVAAEFGLKSGDAVQLGASAFRIAGVLKAVPGEAIASMFTAPRVFIGRTFLDGTGLLRDESLARRSVHFKIDDADLPAALARIVPLAEKNRWRVDTVEERRRNLGRRFTNATRFLKLAALVTLLLGGIGVASILYVYVREKTPLAATLRCLGAPAGSVFAIFVLQGVFLGAAGVLFGAALGVAFQAALPDLMARFVRIEIPFFVSWRSLASGAAAGFGLSFLFTILPLVGLRAVPPLAALRRDYEPGRSAARDPASWAIGLAAAVLLFLFAKSETTRPWMAAAVPGGAGAALLVLALLTKVSLGWLRSRVPSAWPFAWRQGLASLFRPHNQTFVLVSALGLGATLLFTVAFLRSSVLRHIGRSVGGGEPTLALIDVQAAQRDGVRALLRDAGAPPTDEAPIVTMRIESIKGVPAVELLRDAARPRWTLRRDYRSTYRNGLTAGEEVVAGAWPPARIAGETVPVALEEGIAEDLRVGLGDEIIFDVQGVPVAARVAALRRVDWFQIRPNFFVVFPEGALEEAPQFFIMMTRADSAEISAAVQRRAREEFPNVSTVDLRMVLDTIDRYFAQVSAALHVMALFVTGAGLLILAGALAASRYERLKEAALLRTLGASTRQVRTVHLVEYGLTGFFSALAGLGLSLAGSYVLSRRVFEVDFGPGLLTALSGLAGMTLVSVLTGLLLGRGMLRRPPLETLREDA